MDEELVTVQGVNIHCGVVSVPGDGACLFSTLAYLVHGEMSMAAQIRADIVLHVSNEWQSFKCFSMDRHGVIYGSKRLYATEMSKPYTYGTTCELKAAGEIFPYEFQLFHNGILIATFGEAGQGIKRIRFTGHFNEGHFDALLPLDELISTNNVNLIHTSISTFEQADIEMSLPSVTFDSQITNTLRMSLETSQLGIFPNAQIISESASCKIESSSFSTHSAENIKSEQKRRKRFSNQMRKKQIKKAVLKHKINNPESHKVAVKTYTKSHPEINRDAVQKYTYNNPEVNRTSVVKYTKTHPNVNRVAVEKYTRNHPEVHRKSVQKYSLNNPNVNKTSVEKYNKNKREIRSMTWRSTHMSGFKYDPQIDYSKNNIVDLGKRVPCTWCRSWKWQDEPNGMCCKGGKVQLDCIKPFPEPLHRLLIHQHVKSEHFLSLIRRYNGCFQMTSFGAKQINEGDDETEKDIRCGYYSGVNRELVGQLQKLLHEHNRYILDFKAAIETVPKDQNEYKVVINANKRPAGEHKGRFNAPTRKEVAVLIVGQEFDKRDIILHGRDSRIMRISETHRSYDALQYPLMFCRGEDGYQINIPQLDPKTHLPLSKTVSAVDFYSYRLMERDYVDNYLLLYRNLLNQFLVDMYAKIETERLSWIRNNQKKLRSEDYVHLKDALSRTDAQISNFGKMVVLPSSFTGGARYMHERTQDAMTYVRHFGRPDLFITFTCNPKWPEIIELLRNGQKPHDRHDLISRVFHFKVKLIMKLLTKGSLFGTFRCQMYTVEWQKRGLPHIHILLWLEEKIRPESIDKLICAEIPDPILDPTLHEIVKTTMIHGSCGALNRNSPCMLDGKCSKKYPRPLLKESITGVDGYPLYRRRSTEDGGFTANVGGTVIDNRWVVPYNPVLSRIFSAHINVEYCQSVKSIKYICKYVNKGSDQASFTVEDLDEVTRYETGRYISSSEAVWRIFCFPIHERYPPIVQLAVHLENGQRIYFTESSVVDKINNPTNTTLLAFFELCQNDDFARTLLYYEVPAYFVWKNNKFHRRKQGQSVSGYPGVKKDKVLGRVYNVHPTNSECYYLRLLLHQVRGPKSYSVLKTVAGIIYPTFQADASH